MSRIESGLHRHHAAMASSQSQLSTASTSHGDVQGSSSNVIETPFAKVNSIVPGSPAEDSGLKVGDGIRRFGQVSWLNHENLGKIAETVQQNEGVSVLTREL